MIHQERDDSPRQPRSRQRIVWLAANLLIAIGIVLLGTSIVAATHAPSGPPHDVERPSSSGAVLAVSSPTATAVVVPTQAAPTATPQPTVAPGPFPPHAGEGLLEPLPSAPRSTSPYMLNSAASRAIHISVPAVGIDTDIIEVDPVPVQEEGQTLFGWAVADWAAGHHSTSANPGEGGNIVIAGHDDVRGEVFRGLHDIEVGDEVILTTESASYTYIVQEIQMRLYKNAPIEDQVSVSGFIAPMPEERVTLVTCWPYGVDTHRMIVVAKPLN